MDTPTKHRVLVTGAAGAVGRPVCRALLAVGHHVRGFQRKPFTISAGPGGGAGVEDMQLGDFADPEAVAKAVQGMDTVINLGATPDEADFLTQLVPANIIGVYHILNQSRLAGVQRVILASTLRVASGLHHRERRVHLEDGVAPMDFYAVTKCFAEDMGLMYSLRFKLSVIAARIGWLVRNPVELGRMQRMSPEHQASCYLSQDDAGRFFRCAVEAPDIKYAILYAVSRGTGNIGFDIDPGRQLIGYDPRDTIPPQGMSFD